MILLVTTKHTRYSKYKLFVLHASSALIHFLWSIIKIIIYKIQYIALNNLICQVNFTNIYIL